MRKWKPEEVMLFVVPLAFVPIAMAVVHMRQRLPQAPRPPRAVAPTTFGAPRTTAEAIKNILPSRDGRVLFTDGSVRGTNGIHIWSAHTNALLRSFSMVGAALGEEKWLRLSPDSRTMFYATDTGDTGVLVDTRTGSVRARIQRQSNENFWDAAINNQVLAHRQGSLVALRSLRDGSDVGRVGALSKTFPAYLTFSPDGTLLAWVNGGKSSLGSDGMSRIHGIRSPEVFVYEMKKKRLFTLPLLNCVVFAVKISGDNSKLVVLANRRPMSQSSKDTKSMLTNLVLVFSLKSGRQIHQHSLSPIASTALAISPNSRWLALKSSAPGWDENVLQIVDLSTAQTVAREQYSSHAIAFSADSRKLFMDGEHQGLRLTPNGVWKTIY